MSNHTSKKTFSHQEKKQPRFNRLDNEHIKAIESLFRKFPFLENRVEIHLPFHKSQQIFTHDGAWVWPKFDKHPVAYLLFIDGFAPCIWQPDKQEGFALKWIIPSHLFEKGPTICFANVLMGESTLQIEDIVVHNGKDLWSTMKFSDRWEVLRNLCDKIPREQPILSLQVKVVSPIALEDWEKDFDPSVYWIIQPDNLKTTRWFWKDVSRENANQEKKKEFIPPTLSRKKDLAILLTALCKPYTKLNLPDTYSLYSQEGEHIGVASISSLDVSQSVRKAIKDKTNNDGVPVEVKWNTEFDKYSIVRLLPDGSPISTANYFQKERILAQDR
jgi:hypothetical protein